MDREYQSNEGAWFSYPTSFKSLLHMGATQTHKNKSKAGVQRHTRTSYPTTRTTASIITNKSWRSTEHKPGKKAHSRRSSRHRSTISHRHSTPQTRPPKNNRQDGKATQQSTAHLHTYKASSTEQQKAHTHQNISRNLLPQEVLLLQIGHPQLVIQEY